MATIMQKGGSKELPYFFCRMFIFDQKMKMEQLKYPIGKFQKPENITRPIIQNWIAEIEALPSQINALVAGLSTEQLKLTYRTGGWTIRQVVHHIFDSHINSYIRFKWTLTEDQPTIKAYFEDRWAELEDSKDAPVGLSLQLLEGLHQRWAILMKSLTDEQLKRSFFHPESKRLFQLDEMIGLYAWHGKHHLAHIRLALGI